MVDWDEPTMVARDGVAIATYGLGEGPAVVFCPGFPELAFSWHRILPAVADAGYRAIAIDQRGYGHSGCPPRVEEYAVTELAGDVVAVLDGWDVDHAVLVGHDWGSRVVWATALLHPERVRGVVAVNNPYRAAPDVDPLEALRADWGDDHYVVGFHDRGPDDPDSSDARFGANVEQVFRGLYRASLFDMAAFAALPKEQRTLRMEPIVFAADPPGRFVLTDGELARFVAAFERTGFTPGINWYRNISRNWAALKDIDPHIDLPCLMIEVTGDPSGPPGCSADMRPYIADLETRVIEGCGHWTQHEKPAELAAILVDWLGRHVATASSISDRRPVGITGRGGARPLRSRRGIRVAEPEPAGSETLAGGCRDDRRGGHGVDDAARRVRRQHRPRRLRRRDRVPWRWAVR